MNNATESIFQEANPFRKYFNIEQALIRIESYLKDFTYFQKLSSQGKKKFSKRVYSIVVSKEFVGKNNFQITDEIKIRIASCMAQLTFGLNEFRITHYDTILVYPEAFYSEHFKSYLKGATSMAGTIGISWEDFEKGYRYEDDKFNLGIHEIAHALQIDALHGDAPDEHFESNVQDWINVATIELFKIRKGTSDFLRKYAATNLHEFFAVAVEHFFEVPLQLKERLPDIYYNLCYLLNQDPLNTSEDYKISPLLEGKVKDLNKKVWERLPRKDLYEEEERWNNFKFRLVLITIIILLSLIKECNS